MHSTSKTSSRGFTLAEMMISLFVGLIVLGAAVGLYSKGLEATFTVSQRAELQQDARASFNMLTQDISLANAGLSDTPQYTGVGLATGAALKPTYGCDYTGACHLGAGNNASVLYPADKNGIINMYGIVPGWKKGPTINATAGPTDVITIVYLDNAFLLNNYQVMFNNINGTSVTFKMPAPVPNPVPQAVNNAAVGLQQGDLVLFRNGTKGAIAEVTAAPGAGAGPYTVAFVNPSPLGFNQAGATSGSLNTAIIQTAANVGTYLATTTATRVWVITYYIDNTRTTPTLMRLVNGRLPVPVAENVADLRLTYNSYDDTGALLNNTGDGGLTAPTPIMPSSIRTINLTHLTIRSERRGGTKGYEAIDLHTSVSARNMGFINQYD